MLPDLGTSHHVVVEVHVAHLAEHGGVQPQGEVFRRGLFLEVFGQKFSSQIVRRSHVLNQLRTERDQKLVFSSRKIQLF